MSDYTLEGPEMKPASGGPAKQLVIILHGWGADGANLIDLAQPFSQSLPDAHFCAPNGPEVCEVNPYGFQWFSLMNRDPQVMLDGARNAEKYVNAFIDSKLEELSLTTKEFALVGFSQGTMTSLHTALRREKPPVCVVGYSGAMIGAEVLPDEIVSKPPVCLIHGEQDNVVPFAAMAHAEAALKQVGVAVETHGRPMLPHSIDMPGVDIARKFLVKHLLKN